MQNFDSIEVMNTVKVEGFNSFEQTWEDVQEQILYLEETCFPGLTLGEAYLKEKFEDPTSIIFFLKRGEEIIGFAYAIPDENTPGAVYIDTVEIRPEDQGKKLVVGLMKQLEKEALARGYTHVTENAAIGNGYAAKVAKNYMGRIEETYENDSPWGRQRYFKIRL